MSTTRSRMRHERILRHKRRRARKQFYARLMARRALGVLRRYFGG